MEGLTLHIGDCLASLRQMPDQSVHTCVTSPPYFGLRDYGHEGQIGLEDTPEAFVARLVDVFREVRRVLRDDGTLWLNLGDSYFTSPPGNKPGTMKASSGLPNSAENLEKRARQYHGKLNCPGLKQKDLIGIPWRVAFALQADGWYLRQDIIWHKPNPMPESVRDRCTKAHEYVFLLSKSARYYFDADAIKEPAIHTGRVVKATGADSKNANAGFGSDTKGGFTKNDTLVGEHRNRRSVWTVTTKPFRGAHFATFPPDLIEPCILAGAPQRCCAACGAPWERVVEKTTTFGGGSGRAGRTAEDVNASGKWAGQQYGRNLKLGPQVSTETLGFRPTCTCDAGTVGGVVLDPFGGSGTTAGVALRHGRRAVLCELNPTYAAMIPDRVAQIAAPPKPKRQPRQPPADAPEPAPQADNDNGDDLFGWAAQ